MGEKLPKYKPQYVSSGLHDKCNERIQQLEDELNRVIQMASDAYDNFYWSELALYQARCALIWCDECIPELEDALKIIRDGPHSEKCGYCLARIEKAKQALKS